jgi:hypothetical protein
MPLLTAAITQFGDEPTPVPQLIAEPRHAVRITFAPGQQVWVISHDDVLPYITPGASVLKTKLLDEPLPNLNRSAGFDTGKATITSPVYRFVDVDDELTALFADKNVNGYGSYNRLIEEWHVEKDTQIATPGGLVRDTIMPKYTGIIQDHSRLYNIVEIETADISRGLDDEIFEPLKWNLRSGITATQTTIPTTLPVDQIADYQALFQHANWYLADPGVTIGYARIDSTGEIFSYTGFVNQAGIATFTGVTRGVLRTVKSAVDVPINTEPQKRPSISEWIVIDEPATDFVKALIVGHTSTFRYLPKHWSAHKGTRWVFGFSFAKYATPLRFQFQNPGKVKCRDFFEREILTYMGAVLTINGAGQLVWTSRARPVDSDAGSLVLDPSNCVEGNELVLRHVKSDIHPSFKINFDYDAIADKYLSPYLYRDIESEEHNGIEPGKRVKEFSSKGLHSGIHTSTQIQKLVATFGDDYFYEKLSLTIESFINDIPLGSLVTVDFPNVKDDASGTADAEPLKRTMLVTASSESRQKRTTTYTLSGSLYVQSTRQASQRLHNMEVSEYRRGKTNIATLPGISISNGIATGNITLQMGKHYYYVDSAEAGTGLEFSQNLNVTVTGSGPMLGIWVFGPFDCKTTIDLTAKSGHAAGIGQTQNTRATNGVPGYVLTSRSSGSIQVDSVYSTFLSSNETIYNRAGFVVSGGSRGNTTAGRYSRSPDPAIDLNNGILGGLPSDMGGTSGAGGPMSTYYDSARQPQSVAGSTGTVPSTQYINGSNGGVGGGSLLTVSWGFSLTGNGKVILDGGDSGAVNSYTYSGQTIYGGVGGPGGPGVILSVIDGNHPYPVFTATNVIARFGNANLPGIGVYGNSRHRDDGEYCSPLRPTGRFNEFQSCTRVAYTPEPENVQQRSSAIDEFFENQRDGRVRMFIADSDPSNANPGDMRITQLAVDSNASNPPFRVLTREGWRDFVRGVDDFEYVYDALISGQREYGSVEIIASATRPQGKPDGTIWYNTVTKTEWLLYENSDDVLLRENGVPQGENLIDDLSFARSLAGENLWLFTRDSTVAPINVRNPSVATDVVDGGGTSTTVGITLSDAGRTVAGVAYQNDGGGVIVAGRGGTVTLNDGAQLSFTVGSGGAFSVTFPSSEDDNLGLQGSIYTSNSGAGTEAQLNFVYQLDGTGGVPSTGGDTDDGGGGGGGSTSGITLSDAGRTVAGVAYANDGSGIIVEGRGGTVTLNDGTVGNFTVGANGSFSVTFSSAHDNNLGLQASVYTANAASGTDAQLNFVYEL